MTNRRVPRRRGAAAGRSAAHQVAKATTTAARTLFETYGVHFDAALRDEMVARVDRLDLPSYTAFVMPKLTPVRDARGEIVDVEITYPKDFARQQMLEYGQV